MKIGTIFIICLGLFFPLSSRAEFRYVDTTTHNFLWPEDHWNQDKTVVQLSVILPNNATFEANINMTGPGILYGINEAKSRNLINDVVFNVTFRNSGCNSTFGPGSFNNAVFQGVDVILGPTCEYALAPVARMLKFYNLPLLTAGGFIFDFSKPKKEPSEEFHLLTRTGFDFKDQTIMINKTFEKFRWKRVKLIYEKDAQINVTGENTCYHFMKTVVDTIKGKIEYSAIDLDVKYVNQTEKMLTESSAGQEYYSGHACDNQCHYCACHIYFGCQQREELLSGSK